MVSEELVISNGVGGTSSNWEPASSMEAGSWALLVRWTGLALGVDRRPGPEA